MIYNVKVYPGSRRNDISVDGDIKIWTTSKPVDDQANNAVIRQLAEHFGIAKSKIKIIRGDKSRLKIVDIILDK
jgi:uncharacterized protein YggU (UPF0235/DUF167 family)